MAKELSYRHYLKNLKLLERNKEWLANTGVSTKEKMSYYGRMALSISGNYKRIKYLGRTLYYDNPATPLNLQNYPYEISKKILANMDILPKSVLDVGGNLGQFSLTINHILKEQVRIDIFEPNSYIFEYLSKNTVSLDNINIYNYGLGDQIEKKTLYFNPTRTGIGSIMKKNAGEGRLLQQSIDITSAPEKLTHKKSYDLIKIDVEGYEAHALKGLRGVRAKYIFFELSGQTRTKDYKHSEMFETIKRQWGDYDVLYCSGVNKDRNTFDILVRFK